MSARDVVRSRVTDSGQSYASILVKSASGSSSGVRRLRALQDSRRSNPWAWSAEGEKWCIRYYGPDGRQRWETIGPNKKEAETVLHQRLYEVRSGIFPILRRRSQVTFQKLAEEWMASYAKTHVRQSTFGTYRWLLDFHLLPAFGNRTLTTLTPKDIEGYLADKIQQVARKTANHGLVLLKEILEAAVDWGRIPTNPAKRIRKIAVPQREATLWTTAEIREFLTAANDTWRPIFPHSRLHRPPPWRAGGNGMGDPEPPKLRYEQD